MTTRGIHYLKQLHVPHTVVAYDHREKGAEFASRSVGYPLSRTVKTLVIELDRGRFCLALVPGDRRLSLKKCAAVCGCKKACLADNASAERLTGYVVGGISPFGTKRKLETLVDRSLQHTKEIMINAGRRGMMLNMAPGDIIRTLDAIVADIASVP